MFEDLPDEWREWFALTPLERLKASEQLWSMYLSLGGQLDPEPDPQSPFYFPEASRACAGYGGQACVLYGAVQFSKDIDFLILADPENFERLHAALAELCAERIAVPPFAPEHLARGHAVHFRCQHPDVAGLRVDVMTQLRHLRNFEDLWARRYTVDAGNGEIFELLNVGDLVQAKKTQRDKDWPVVSALVESHYFAFQNEPTPERITFWLTEARNPESLIELAARFPVEGQVLSAQRPLLATALKCDVDALRRELMEEELRERQRDREYWAPLKAELEVFRRAERQG